MDVSNTTGEGAGYKVVGGGGMPPHARLRDRAYVEVRKDVWYEVLAEGTLEPFTYLSVKPRKKIHAVVFHRSGRPLCTCVTEEDPQAKAAKSTDLLVSLTQNGTSNSAKTCVCRKKA